MSLANQQADEYFVNASQWKVEMDYLRSILLECGLFEEIKWKVPCYTYDSGNIAMIGSFKAHCTLSFFKGTLLNDPLNLLQKPGDNSQSVKMFSFTKVEDIQAIRLEIKDYVFEAIEIQKAGTKVNFKKLSDDDFPQELVETLDKNPKLKEAFKALTPGRQRGYWLYFAQAKQSKTRQSRIDNSVDRIMRGKGIHDCVCGLSKRYPRCDGSHKSIGEA